MATIKVYSAARMKQIEDESVVGGHVDGNDLILTTRAGTNINAGNVRGATGSTGATGPAGAGITQSQLNVVDNKASAAQSTANSALSTANSALAAANASNVVSRGAQQDGGIATQWLRFSNGVQILWLRAGGNLFGGYSAAGSLWTTRQLMYLMKPFVGVGGAPIPSIAMGECLANLGLTWGQIEEVTNDYFYVRLWSPIGRAQNEGYIISAIAFGYWKTPT